jgi:hypothetical protein
MKTTNMFARKLYFVLAFTFIAAAAAHGESFSIHVPFPFAASGKMLPPGDYTIEPIATGLVALRGATGAGTTTIAASPMGYTDSSANPSLSFAGSTEVAVLARIRMDSGMTFSVMPARRLAAASAVPAKGTVALAHP